MATPVNPGISRIEESYNSAIKILETNKAQLSFMNQELKPDNSRVESIYKNAEDALTKAKAEAESKINNIKDDLYSSKYNEKVKSINKKLIKELGEVLVNYNKELIYTTLSSKTPENVNQEELKQMVDDLSNNTVKGKFLRLAAKLFERDFIQKYFKTQYDEGSGLMKQSRVGDWLELRNKTAKIFKAFKKDFIEAGRKRIEQSEDKSLTTKSKFDRAAYFINEPKDALTRNSQVVGVGTLYAVGLVFSNSKAAKQIKSHIAQQADLRERETFKESLKFEESGERQFTSTFIPLNRELDRYVSNDNDSHSTFGNIFGDAGASSANREVEHVINGYLNQLEIVGEGQTGEVAGEARRLHQVLRHGVIAFRFETDPEKRIEAARQMTEELMTAALLISIAQSGKSLEDVAKMDRPWKQAVISISLITPDMVLGLVEDVKQLGKGKKMHASEEKMWRSQYEALKEYNGVREITLGGHALKVDFKTTSFNTGVNAGANRFALGTLEQWKTVQAEKRQLDSLTNPAIALLKSKKKALSDKYGSLGAEQIKELQIISSQLRDLENLQKDIHRLTRTPFSYLGNGNQYELAAKMEILGNRLADLVKAYPKDDLGIDGIMVFVNCMSAKDRTGAEVACAFTFEVMRERLGHYPTTEEMRKSGMQDIFVRTYKEMLEKYGGDKVTEINVGTGGLKVTKDVLLYPNSKAWGNKEESLAFIQKLSGTAGA